jgi:16S rRNA (guanine(1405)-N(7))-methyltransferase
MTPSEPSNTIDDVVVAIRASSRYRHLDDTLIRRLAAQALVSSRGAVPEAIKRTKRHLHQVYGAYVNAKPRYERLLVRLREAHVAGTDAFRHELQAVMGAHASTRERVPNLEAFYAALFARVGAVTSIVDVGCGLNPLAIPWMALPAGGRYTAIDVDAALVSFVAGCLQWMPVTGQAIVADVVANPPRDPSDLALMLKMLPCLERQGRDAGVAVMRALNVKTIAVSFPVRSLGGRGKGMRENYGRAFEDVARREGWAAEPVAVPGELLYVVTK